jgi:hypothetical protein
MLDRGKLVKSLDSFINEVTYTFKLLFNKTFIVVPKNNFACGKKQLNNFIYNKNTTLWKKYLHSGIVRKSRFSPDLMYSQFWLHFRLTSISSLT